MKKLHSKQVSGMKAVILAGGFGTRISEESHKKPKPMVEIGERPILWHIMKIYSRFGVNDFVICLGYKSYVVKEYFANYYLHDSDVTMDMRTNDFEYHRTGAEPWRVTLVDTGLDTLTGGRLKRIKEYVCDENAFFMTYGDGVAQIDIDALFSQHIENGTIATVTAVQPPGRFGMLQIDGRRVQGLQEKPRGDGGWINGGFFVLAPEALDYISSDDVSWEREPMSDLANDGQLSAYKHTKFWHPLDTLRDLNYLESLWNSGDPPWKV